MANGDPKAGTRIGSYTLGERIGERRLGVVYRAKHHETGQDAAIRLLDAAAVVDDVNRMNREYVATAKLDHPCCLRMYEAGESELGHYVAMEYAPGGGLQTLNGSDNATLLPVVLAITRALDHVHQLGVVHGDLRPESVLLSADLQPKITGFGVAQVHDTSGVITGTGAVVSVIDYVAPEVLRGQKFGPPADLYSLGCLIFVLWSGDPPFVGDNFERLQGRLRGTAPALTGAVEPPAALVELTAKLLQRDPAARPASASEAAAIIEALC